MDYPGKIINKNATLPTQASASGVWTVDDALIALRSNTWPIAGVLNPISKSLRFNSADSAYLNRTPASASNRTTWTWSAWVKRGDLSTATRGLFGAGTASSTDTGIYWTSADKIDFFDRSGGSLTGYVSTNAVFRDPSAWYHIVVVFDSGNATAANRMLIYINNVSQSLTVNNTLPQNTQSAVNNTVAHALGSLTGGSNVGNGYMTEVNFIDGQALTPSSFGATDAQTGQWIPKKYTGTYGTNGFYVNFSDSASTGALGTDYSGNGNNWTPNNFSVTAGAGNDSLTDVPTPWIAYSTNSEAGAVIRGNYATWNPISAVPSNGANSVTNGNLDFSTTGAEGTVEASMVSTMALPTTGKWYWEITPTSVASGAPSRTMIGIMAQASIRNTFAASTAVGNFGYTAAGASGSKVTEASFSSYGASYTANDVIGVAVDLDNGAIYFAKNGTWQNSGVPTSGASKTGAAFTTLVGSANYFPAVGYWGAFTANFGQRPFAYTPPTGYKSLCATNLPTPTIGATTTTQAGKYFNPVLYTGNSSSRTITGVGFQPDFTWIKIRDAIDSHYLFDAVRGKGTTYMKTLYSNATNAESPGNSTSLDVGVTDFASDGFTFGSGTLNGNQSPYTFVAWNWKANGAGSTNTAGSITSTVSANTTSGFSIVTWTGNGTAGATIGHGLGVAPAMIIAKRRNAADNWPVYHSALGATYWLRLNSSIAAVNTDAMWNNTAPTSTVFTVKADTENNASGGTYVAYCFAEVPGFSKFGSYVGGSSVKPFVYCGFRPAYIMIKYASAGSSASWVVWDNKRNTYNAANSILTPNTSNAEFTGSVVDIDFLSNGFCVRGTDGSFNDPGVTYIFAAFAEFPFKFANAR
jgi:hypothetical protein